MYQKEISKEKKAIIVFMLGLLYFFIDIMSVFLQPIILSCILAMMIHPIYAKLLVRLKNKKNLTAMIVTLSFIGLVVVPMALIITILIEQLYQIVGDLNLKETFSVVFSHESYVLYLKPVILEIENTINTKIDFLGLLTQLGKQAAQTIYSFSPSVLLGTANFIFDFGIMIVTFYFLLIEGPALVRVIFDISPLRETHERRLAIQFKKTIDASIHGYLLTSFAQALIATFFFKMSGFEVYVVLGVLTFFMSMVPIVGAAGVWVPIVVVLFFKDQTNLMILNLVGGIIVSIMDNFLKPIIIQGQIAIHPLLIFFSLFGAIQIFGPLGILFGPVITASLIAVIKIYREEFL